MTATDVDGYTTADPVSDEDWEDVVRWEVNYVQARRHEGHNRNGWFAHEAGGEACRALGHPQPSELQEDGESWEEFWERIGDHERGWDGEELCQATAFGTCCTECQSEDCPWEPADAEILWAKVRA